MKNFYEKTDMRYPEKAIALEDFEYGTMVKCSIPILTPFIDKNNIKENSIRLFKNKIANINKDILGIDRYNSCNYIELFIPKDLCKNNENKGFKGEEFVCIFLGGDINKCSIIARSDN